MLSYWLSLSKIGREVVAKFEEHGIVNIKVTVTGTDKYVKSSEFPVTESTPAITGSTVPIVAKENTEEAIEHANDAVELLKNFLAHQDDSIELTIDEEEMIDRGWFSHFDFKIKYGFSDGEWELSTTSVPKKEIKKKKTKIRVNKRKKK